MKWVGGDGAEWTKLRQGRSCEQRKLAKSPHWKAALPPHGEGGGIVISVTIARREESDVRHILGRIRIVNQARSFLRRPPRPSLRLRDVPPNATRC